MSSTRLAILACIFFLTSIISVVTGSTSLITVPAMIALGIEAHVAVATNMLALIFMSSGGSLPFLRSGTIDRRHLPLSILLTVAGSILGAFFLLETSTRSLQVIVGVAMVIVSGLMMWRQHDASHPANGVSRGFIVTGYLATFLLAIYGGFFSGGYVTLLTAAFVAFFGMTFHQSIATTKVINVFSSTVATAVFLRRGIVDVRLGILLGIVMFFGAILGSQVALRLSATWLRRIFLVAVFALAAKMLFSAVK